MKSHIKYQGRISAIVEEQVTLPNGASATFEFAERPPGVRILAFQGDAILLTREWREEIGGTDLRLPGGKVFDRYADFAPWRNDPQGQEQCARLAAVKELAEETTVSAEAGTFKLFAQSECGATVRWRLYYYTVELAARLPLPDRVETDEGELISPEWRSAPSLLEGCLNGEIKEQRSVAVILRWLGARHANLFNLQIIPP